MDWNQAQIEFMLLAFDKGQSMAQIANLISEEFHMTISRSAVIGKLHRLQVTRIPLKEAAVAVATAVVEPKVVVVAKPRAPPPSRQHRQRRAALSTIPSPLVTNWNREPPANFHCDFLELDATRCHWPFGDSPPYSYCGATAAARGYCTFHYRKSITKRKEEFSVG